MLISILASWHLPISFLLFPCHLSFQDSIAKYGSSSEQPFPALETPVFDGYGWCSALRHKHLPAVRKEYHILEDAVMDVPLSRCCDREGFACKVTLTTSLLFHGLRLPFYRSLHNILDLLGLKPAQLHPFVLRAFLCACLIFRMALEPIENIYPNLTA